MRSSGHVVVLALFSTLSAACAEEPAPAPAPARGLVVEPERLDFGEVSVGVVASGLFEIANTGDATVEIQGAVLAGANAFSVDSVPARLEPGARATVRASCRATSLERIEGALLLRSAGDVLARVELSAQGVAPSGCAPCDGVNTRAVCLDDGSSLVSRVLGFCPEGCLRSSSVTTCEGGCDPLVGMCKEPACRARVLLPEPVRYLAPPVVKDGAVAAFWSTPDEQGPAVFWFARVNGAGDLLGAPVEVERLESLPRNPYLSSSTDGYVVAWVSGDDVWLARLDEEGALLDEPLRLEAPAGWLVELAAVHPSDDAVTVLVDQGEDRLRVARFAPDGQPLTPWRDLPPPSAASREGLWLLPRPGGYWAVAWHASNLSLATVWRLDEAGDSVGAPLEPFPGVSGILQPLVVEDELWLAYAQLGGFVDTLTVARLDEANDALETVVAVEIPSSTDITVARRGEDLLLLTVPADFAAAPELLRVRPGEGIVERGQLGTAPGRARAPLHAVIHDGALHALWATDPSHPAQAGLVVGVDCLPASE